MFPSSVPTLHRLVGSSVWLPLLLATALVAPHAASSQPFTYVDRSGQTHQLDVTGNDEEDKALVARALAAPAPASAATTGAEPAYRWEAEVREAARTYGVPVDLLRAVIEVESANRPGAVSRSGAQGLMQLMPGTASDLGVARPFDPRENVLAGTRYLAELLRLFDGDEVLAVAAYNAGPEAVRRAGGVPLISETRGYVSRVLERYQAHTNERLGRALAAPVRPTIAAPAARPTIVAPAARPTIVAPAARTPAPARSVRR